MQFRKNSYNAVWRSMEGGGFMMYPDQLYQLAFEFRKEKLWKSLPDASLFAVSLPGREIGYCNIMGFLGEHLALGLYVGEKGFDTYRRLLERGEVSLSPFQAQELLFGQDCLQCAFENKDELSPKELSAVRAYAGAHQISFRGGHAFPQFMRYRPARYPIPISRQTDIRRLSAALEAALEVSARLKTAGYAQLGFQPNAHLGGDIPLLTRSRDGFDWSRQPLPPRHAERYPEPILRDELLAARLKGVKKRAGAWVCDVVMLPTPYTPESGSPAPVFPYTVLAADCRANVLIPVCLVEDYENGAETLLRNLALRMLEQGVPANLQVVNDRSYALLKNLAAQLHIRLTRRPGNPFLDEVEEDLMDHISGSESEESAEEQLTESLLNMDDETILSMPEDLWRQLREMDQQGLLPEALSARLWPLFQKRK